MTKIIKLSKGYETIVDDDDYIELSKHKWYAAKSSSYVYAKRDININGKKKILRMHRVIMNAPDDMIVDHKNLDSLDNRRENLRLVTKSENKRNNSIPYGGAKFNKSSKKHPWQARIKVNGKDIYLGCFSSKEEALDEVIRYRIENRLLKHERNKLEVTRLTEDN